MRTLSTTELEEMDEDEFLLINVLGEQDHRKQHIPGSVNIPLDRLEENLDGLPEDKKIVVYCKSIDCEASEDAARKLQKHGFDNVLDYAPGIKAWKNSGNNLVGEGE